MLRVPFLPARLAPLLFAGAASAHAWKLRAAHEEMKCQIVVFRRFAK